MTDQIYYKIQYPIKKAISILKQVDPDAPFAEENRNFKGDIEELESFLEMWDEKGKKEIRELVDRLRQSQ